jgi:hypothetical protein
VSQFRQQYDVRSDDIESSDPIDIDDVERRGVDGGEDVGVDANSAVDRPTETGLDVVDPAADDEGFLVVLDTSGSGSRRMPSALMQ